MRRPYLSAHVSFALLLSILATPTGLTCQATARGSACADFPDVLKPGCIRRVQEGKRNWVLNSMALGLDALQLGLIDLSARCFDDALLGIEQVYAQSEQAAKARGMWKNEGSKDFKGEPYERAMAYYYRGLIDLMEGDIDNARASFRGGALQDAFAEEEQNRCDFGLLIFLQGWCSKVLGDIGLMEAAFEELQSLRSEFPRPKPDDNVLLVIELGTAPRKRTDGIGHGQLKFFRGKGFPEEMVKVRINEQSVDCYPMESVYWQASTRGARPIDCILEGKARYKESLDDIGTSFNNPGMDFQANLYAGTSTGTTANALGIIGGVFSLISSKVKAKADDRYWANLPDSIYVGALSLGAGEHTMELDFFDEAGNQLPDLAKSLRFTVDPGSRSAVIWMRSRDQIQSQQSK